MTFTHARFAIAAVTTAIITFHSSPFGSIAQARCILVEATNGPASSVTIERTIRQSQILSQQSSGTGFQVINTSIVSEIVGQNTMTGAIGRSIIEERHLIDSQILSYPRHSKQIAAIVGSRGVILDSARFGIGEKAVLRSGGITRKRAATGIRGGGIYITHNVSLKVAVVEPSSFQIAITNRDNRVEKNYETVKIYRQGSELTTQDRTKT